MKRKTRHESLLFRGFFFERLDTHECIFVIETFKFLTIAFVVSFHILTEIKEFLFQVKMKRGEILKRHQRFLRRSRLEICKRYCFEM